MSTPLQLIRQGYKDIMGLKGNQLHVVDAICCVAHSINYSRAMNPLWVILRGEPSVGKSETLRPFTDENLRGDIIRVDSLTAHGMVSGYRDHETGDNPSLLAQLTFKVLVCHDLDPSRKDFESVMEVMRGSYDSDYALFSGMEALLDFNPHYGFIAGATGAIDDKHEFLQKLGARMLTIQYPSVTWGRDRITQTIARSEYSEKKTYYRQALAEIVKQQLEEARTAIIALEETSRLDFPKVKATKEQLWTLAALAEIVTLWRTSPHKSDSSEQEGSLRLFDQLKILASCRAVLDGRSALNNEDLELARYASRSTLPLRYYKIIFKLYHAASMSQSELSGLLSVTKQGKEWLGRQILQWHSLKVLERSGACWKIAKDQRDLMTETLFLPKDYR